MCAIIGAVLFPAARTHKLENINAILETIWKRSHERGRDGRGYYLNNGKRMVMKRVERIEAGEEPNLVPKVLDMFSPTVLIGNLRAEPTTEFVSEKLYSDQQPYSVKSWNIAHNGTIANDSELRTYQLSTPIDSAAIAEQLAPYASDFEGFIKVIKKIKGSYAILAAHNNSDGTLYVAANYRPIWYIKTEYGVFFASSENYFPAGYAPIMLEPYTAAAFSAYGCIIEYNLRPIETGKPKALVVCSGGLDSVVSATYAQKVLNLDIHLIHFLYGSRAEGPEVAAIKNIAKELDVPLTLFPLSIYEKGDSPLLDNDSEVAGGESGAEFAHEWVPARNLVLLSVATAFAEAKGMTTLVLGNNLEEAGAYPDNEPEFINKFNKMLPFAVGDGRRMSVIMPVGNLMKHEIVKLGNEIGAPMHLTWSCYRAGELHCGKCGPCYMRRKAFEINKLDEVIKYKD